MSETSNRGQWRWRSSPRPAGPPELRDQLALRIGWVRFWLRAAVLGLGLWLIGASLMLWPQLVVLTPVFFLVGSALMPLGLVLGGLSWILPLPHEHATRCGACGHSERVLALPWTLPYTCRGCHRKGAILRGRIQLHADEGDAE